MATIFITGATGLIGSHLCKYFLDSGHNVHALKRPQSDLKLLGDHADQIHWKTGDITDPYSLQDAFQDMDYVIHSAAIISFEKGNREAMMQVNVSGTMNVLSEVKKNRIKKFCFISSSAALGKPLKGQMIDENIDTESSIKNTWYAKSKYLAEQAVWSANKEGVPVLIVNPPVVLGVGDWNQSSSRLIDYAWKEKTFYPGGIVNIVDLRDLVRMIDKLLISDVVNEQFIVSGHSILYKELFNRAAQHMDRIPPKRKLSTFFAECLWRIEKLRSTLTGSKPFITRENAKSTSSKFIYSNDKVRSATGLEFTPLEHTIAHVCDAYVKQQHY